MTTLKSTQRLKARTGRERLPFDSSDIILDPYVTPAPGKTGRRSPRTSKVEKVKLPAGTTVLVKAIVGDDAHVEIKDGSSAGANYWVECVRLEPLTK